MEIFRWNLIFVLKKWVMDVFHNANSVEKKQYVDNQDRLLNKQKFYNKENRDQIIEYQKKYNKESRANNWIS